MRRFYSLDSLGKTCPHCGEEQLYIHYDEVIRPTGKKLLCFMTCKNCGATGEVVDEISTAIERANEDINPELN